MINKIFESLSSPIDSINFHQEIFSAVCALESSRRNANLTPIESLCLEEFDFLSQEMDRSKVQESVSARNVLRTRALASLLIDDAGDIDLDALSQAIRLFKKHLYSLGPGRQFDSKRQEHILNVLELLLNTTELQKLLKFIAKPYQNKYLDDVIRETLLLQAAHQITDGDARKATLAAWLCTLRQNVGSCFATAPSILIHDEQPHLFLKDISELFSTGKLKRTYEGMEFSVPLSTSWGAGDLRKPFVISRDPEALTPSPGIVDAFIAARLIEDDKDPSTQTKTLILEWLEENHRSNYYIITTAEELLKQLLLKSCQITQKELQDYEKHSKTHAIGIEHLHASANTRMKIFTNFYQRLNSGRIAFKALADNALLKTWEFTLASFSEAKSQFSTWNLYSSLGLQPQEPNGIGEAIYNKLKEKLDEANRELEEIQYDYEQAYNHLKYVETRLQTARDEQDAEYLKSEYRNRRMEFQAMEERKNRIHAKANRYSSLLNDLIDKYSDLFPEHFQEVYDADMHGVSDNPYDDSPAGFRLIFKGGRSATSQWQRINTPEEFIEALATFFVLIESQIISAEEFQSIESEISDITSAIIMQIRTTEFLESAFNRMARAHQTRPIDKPLENLDKIAMKPWAYTSGGLMNTFVCSYWKRDSAPTESGRWVENTMELLVFLADCMKQEPKDIADLYLKDPNKSMLIHSPTHAFLFKPGRFPFKKTWMNEAFTYTRIRDDLIAPMQRFVDNIVIDQQMAYFLKDKLLQLIPAETRHYTSQVLAYFPGGMNPKDFREYVLNLISQEPALRMKNRQILSADQIDSLLFSLLPLFPDNQLYDRIESILKLLPGVNATMLKKFEALWMDMPISKRADPLVSAKTLLDITKGFLCLLLEQTTFPYDYHKLIAEAAQELQFAMPMPLLFADTNWVHDEFGFVVNPGNGECELWRFDPFGNTGSPMSIWGEWLNGSRRDRTWGVYTRPYEYVL